MAMANVVSVAAWSAWLGPVVCSHLALVLHSVEWTGWNLAMAVPWWQHYKHWHWYYYYYYK